MTDLCNEARQYAIKRLSAQSYHSVMLSSLMRRKGFSSAAIASVIEEFKQKGFLNDAAWVENYVRSHQKRQSRIQIAAKLKSRGIAVDDTMLPFNEEEELIAIKKLIASRYRTKERQKVIAALLRRGFSWDVVRTALDSDA